MDLDPYGPVRRLQCGQRFLGVGSSDGASKALPYLARWTFRHGNVEHLDIFGSAVLAFHYSAPIGALSRS
jgi:hypothetical protein